MTNQPLNLTPIQNRLNHLHEEASKAANQGHMNVTTELRRARQNFQLHAADDIEHLLEEIHRLRAEHQEHPNKQLIQTMEELRELPEGTVIHDRKRWVWERLEDDWYTTGSPQTIYTAFDIFPARIIWTPEEGDQQ